MFNYRIERKIKVTQNQRKKHCSDFSDKEYHLLSAIVHCLQYESLTISNHARQHIPFLNSSIIQQTIENCEIIEFNLTEEKPRLLVRSRDELVVLVDGIKESTHVCIVVDILSNKVITSYLNRSSDFHSGLRADRYESDLDIIKYAMRN